MKNLKLELSVLNAKSTIEEIEKTFDSIAETLLNYYHIRKGNTIYRLLEIEFYFCNGNHPDKVTYSRTETEGRWFLHESGVDLTFNSNEKEGFYEGILIRSIMHEDSKECVFGPRNCLWELFDGEALSKNDEYPNIEPNKEISYMAQIEKRERYRVKGLYNQHKYRYYIAGINADKYPASPWKI